MARQNINIGSSANDGTGDPLRTAFDKINDNFIELYGADGDSNTLANNLDVNGHNIISSRSNEDIKILPAGTGGVIASAVRIAGTTISSDDSTQITIAENVQTTGTLNVSGAATIDGALSSGTSLTLATGATVTGIDNGTLATGSATLLATQSAIKTYVDAQVTAQDLDFSTDDSTSLSIDLDSESLQFSGGNGINTSGSGNTVTIAVDTGTVATLTDTQVMTNKTLTAPTINGATMTGNVTVDNITLNDNIISSASNADLIFDPSGTGDIKLTATSTDITGNASVSGTLSTADITTTGNQTISGSLTPGSLNVGDLNITAQGRITTDTNGDVDIDPSGTGAINLTGPTNITGTATVTGQLNADNLRMDGNTISATTGGMTIDAATGQNITFQKKIIASDADITLIQATTVRTDTLQNDTSNGDISISTQGTGVVDFNTATQSTIGANGAASALTANPVGYLKIKIAGADRIIPFYNA
jgi:hypothetical protein